MLCTRCGKQNPGEVSYCAFCGSPVHESARPTGAQTRRVALLSAILTLVLLVLAGAAWTSACWYFAGRVRAHARTGATGAAVRVYSQFMKVSRRHRPELLLEIAASGLNAKQPWAREAAADALCELCSEHDTQVIRLLEEKMSSASEDYSLRIASRLAVLGRSRGVAKLCELVVSPDPWTRRSAAETLFRYPRDDAVSALQQGANDRRETVRAYAAGALVRLGEGKYRPIVLAALRSRDADTRLCAAEVLATLGDHGGMQVIKSALADESSCMTAISIARSLGTPSARDTLARIAGNRSQGWSKGEAALALGRLGDQRVVPILKDMLQSAGNDPAWDWTSEWDHVEASRCLAALGYPEGLAGLRANLKKRAKDYIAIRAAAALGVGAVRDSGSVRLLEEALRDKPLRVKLTAAAALWRITSTPTGAGRH